MEHLRGSARPAVEQPSDGELLERFVSHRDEAAFVELVRRHGAVVLGVCRRVLDTAEDVEDAFQATFMVLVRKADSIRKRDSAASWLYGVALRVARRARASLTRRRDRERRAAVPEAIAPPEEAWRDLRPVLDAAVETLPEKYRVLVVLCYLQGRTYDEAARLLDLAKGTVSTRLTHARTLLRRRLRQRGLVLPVTVLAVLLERNAASAAVPPRLPPLAVEAARTAAGRGGSVSARVASLAEAAVRQRLTLQPRTIAALTLALVAVASGLLLWRGLASAPAKTEEGGPTQVWEARHTIADQPLRVWRLTYSPDNQTLVSQADDSAVRLWDAGTGQQKALLKSENALSHMFIGFTPDSRQLVTVGAEGPIVVWDAAAAQEITRFPGGWTTTLAPDGKSIATVGGNGVVHLIAIASREDRALPDLVPGPIRALTFSPDSATLAVGGGDGTIFFFDRTTLQQRRRLPGNAMPTLELAFSPDGMTLAALYGKEKRMLEQPAGEVRLWQLASGESRALAARTAIAMAFAFDSQTFATEEPNGAMNLWEPATGVRRLRLGGGVMGTRMLRVVFSPDGTSILTTTPGGVQVRETASGRVLATLRGHAQPVFDAAFGPDGRTLATGTTARQIEDAPPGQAEIRIWERVE